MKCAFCGNEDPNTLFNEDDTYYCSKCYHRTRISDGEDDVLECPYCHRLRDRKAAYCRWCNVMGWDPSTSEEFKEIDDVLKEMGV